MNFIYTFIISIFFSGIFYYLINYSLIPYNEENILDIKNLVIVSIVFGLAFATFFASIHQSIDKLFFCKFYEKPSLAKALRRGILLGLLLVSTAWLRVFGFWELHIVALVIALAVLIEALFISFERWVARKKKVEAKDKGANDTMKQ